jgi:hypothetical protein
MYCNCSNKKKIVTHIDSQRVEVCSKRLGGCGKEIGTTPPYTFKGYSIFRTTINLTKSDIGKYFRTRSGETVKLIQVSDADNYPFIFEGRDSSVITTNSDGSFSTSGNEHKHDIVEML